jgi:anti-anti-sigma factor
MRQAAIPPPEFRVDVTRSPHGAVLALVGELDLATADAFAAEVRHHFDAGPVLLDLGALSFLDSSGVRALDALRRDVDRHGWTLAIAPDLQPGVRRLLDMTGLLAELPFRDPPAGPDAS